MDKRIILVTGASGGIGAATCKQAALAGYQIVMHYHRATDAAQQLLSELHEMSAEAIALQADLSKESDVLSLFGEIDSAFGRVDAVVNNAGVLEKQMRLEDMDAARLERIFATNVINYFLCCKEAVKRMSTRHGGSGGAIVNVSSVAARLGSPGEYIDYAASKGAVDTMTIGLAAEVAQENIRVNGIRPGVIHTQIHALGGEPDRINRVRTNIPMQRGGEPDEVASGIMWLLSDQASYVTGSFIDISGGR